MPIDSAAIGDRIEVSARVETRWALAYAAALGFDPDVYLNDARAGGLIITPTFCVCLEWLVSGHPRKTGAMGMTDEEKLKSVHAMQDSQFHRPYRADETVKVSSEIRYMRETSAGTFVLSLHETRNTDNELICSSWGGVMYRSVKCDRIEAGTPPLAYKNEDELLPFDAETAVVATDRGLPHVYTECSRIWNPIHTERAVAVRAGLPDILLHGTATWAIAARELTNLHSAGDVRRISRVSAKFRAPVGAGDKLTIRHKKQDSGGYRFDVSPNSGRLAVSGGLIEFSKSGLA